ncbi:nitrate reductase molybdenum cofactor assembly chaperone [Streptomyces sp. ID05-04B]|uniref:nitrate reductase molybdenum cofactor assembly chaperone n=1 Tax=unclassified Streptomyces TaxID=2593676 RepID=UPI000D1B1FDB|nr:MULTISPECIES: nitrate reductase molybdenum cofactor assembly chaperone [unclassified Streptomyces]AVV45947.1 nitrate reductase molybdenum cofactor assembly chaperone [Streptomyces sp. P3]MDX5565265.1 nitrate reductase molybdenum cofactor assembly chaperone [Streptomyces sp. ID05-04B]
MKKTKRATRAQSWHAHAWQAQSLLLAYPDEQFEQRLALARRVAATLPEPVARPLLRFAAHAEQNAPADLATAYVATFDHRKRCCLYLTYYAHGDTRKRGLALLRLKQTYAAAGWRLGDDELPDHLAVVLEFAATDPQAGHRLLVEHRAGLELLRLALDDDGSPWAPVLDSVSATLPALAGDDREAVLRLAAQGPPEEQVGLDPYASPVFLPDPVVGGPR